VVIAKTMARDAPRITVHPIADSLVLLLMLDLSSCCRLGSPLLLSLSEKSYYPKERRISCILKSSISDIDSTQIMNFKKVKEPNSSIIQYTIAFYVF
jgi:hypothetical protein